MENSKLLTILVEVDEGTKTPFKAYNEILSLFWGSSSLDLDKKNKQFDDILKTFKEIKIQDWLDKKS